MHVVVGTAGHIDHGKSALVKALTGTDPDRLKEEKERGMTTDLGFAFLGSDITIIDVPGHERFVRHMLAGASTIDFVVLVVAADDGVMPQTREHFEICRLMGIRKGMVAINKADLVDSEWLEMIKLDVAEMVKGSFLEGAPMAAVSALTEQGVPELRQMIVELARKVEAKQDRGVFRMPVDRNFSMKGFGTVVAGTVLSGHVRVGDTLELLPQKREVRVRGIQKHNQMLETLGLGERAALNLQGLEREAVVRGNVLATPGYYTPTVNFNASFYLLKSVEKPLRNLSSLKLHIGTAEVMCRVALLDTKGLSPGQEALVQVRAEEPVHTGKLRSETGGRVYDHGERIAAVIGVRARSIDDHAKAGALEYGAKRPFEVRAHTATLTHLWGRAIAPITINVGAYTRTPNIDPERYLRGPTATYREEALQLLRKAVDEATAEASR